MLSCGPIVNRPLVRGAATQPFRFWRSPTCLALHLCADDGLPPGTQKSVAPGQEDRHGQHFRGGDVREAAERRLIDDLLGLFGGRTRPIMAHLVESGTLTLDDVREAEKTLLKLAEEETK